MRINPYIALLDTCVLAPMPVVDTLLRLAEEAFYVPRWSTGVLNELGATLRRFQYTGEQVEHRIAEMQRAFPEAMVTEYESLRPV